MLGAWLDSRQDYDLFWGRTPAEIFTIVNAVRKRDEREHEEARVRNYELANLITFAQHDPKKMPEYKPTTEPPKARSDEVDQVKARGAMIAWALSNGASG